MFSLFIFLLFSSIHSIVFQPLINSFIQYFYLFLFYAFIHRFCLFVFSFFNFCYSFFCCHFLKSYFYSSHYFYYFHRFIFFFHSSLISFISFYLCFVHFLFHARSFFFRLLPISFSFYLILSFIPLSFLQLLYSSSLFRRRVMKPSDLSIALKIVRLSFQSP